MTHDRLNQPTAYGSVPGPPINPELGTLAMTTETKAELTTDGHSVRREDNSILAVADTHEVADWIAHRLNLHDELVDFVTEVIGFSVNLRQTDPNWQDHQDVGVLYAKATTLLAKAKTT